MKKTWIIARRELSTFFDSLMAYILLALFLGFSGFFTWFSDYSVFSTDQATMQLFFGFISYWTLFFFIPALTMRSIAEENRSGTIQLLLTKPVTYWELIFGKFLAALLMIVIAVAFTIPYYITIANLGPIDHGAVLSGYLGIILMSGAYISIGIFTSSISSNQIVAFLLAIFIGIFFHLIFGLLGTSAGIIGKILNYLSMVTHLESVSRGVIDLRDIMYFLSIIFISLIATEVVLRKKTS